MQDCGGEGPCPTSVAPKLSPDGPSATVPVLGCSFPKESYPSLANQPSTGAKQGDVQCVSEGEAAPPRGSVLCLLSSLCPRGLHAQHLPWDSLACWRGPSSDHVLGNPGLFFRESPAHSTGQDRQIACHQPLGGLNLSMGRNAQATTLGKWILRKGSLFPQGQEGPSQYKGRKAHLSKEVPGREGFLSPQTSGSWYKATPSIGYVQNTLWSE